MRIASAFYTNESVRNLMERQRQLSESQAQMTSGKRVQKASDDPADAARAERDLALSKRTEATLRAVDVSRNAMTLTEGAFSDANDAVQTAREALVSLGNGSYTDSDRQAQVLRLKEVRSALLGIANRQDANGTYLFGATGTSSAPFSLDGSGAVAYSAGAGDRQAASISDEPMPLTVNGGQAWRMDQGGTDVFAVLQTAISALDVPGATAASTAQAVKDGVAGMDVAFETLLSARTVTGEVLNRLDGIESRLGSLKLTAEADSSNATDLDMIEALSRFQSQQTGYQAALQTYASVQRMSLFQYLNG